MGRSCVHRKIKNLRLVEAGLDHNEPGQAHPSSELHHVREVVEPVVDVTAERRARIRAEVEAEIRARIESEVERRLEESDASGE